MSPDAIRDASAEHFRLAKMDAAEVSETTPSLVTEEIETFAVRLGGKAEFVPVAEDEFGLYGWCSDGVRQKAEADGGSIAFGWTIWEWPGVLLTGEFHAVWQDEDGALVDITPKPGGERRILFVHDPSYPADFDFDERPRNLRMRIHQSPDREDELVAIRARLSPGQLSYEEKRAAKAGVPLDEWLRRKLSVDDLADTIDELIGLCDAFDEHFDSLGVHGQVAVDAKFKSLGLRRIAAQNRLKRMLRVSVR